MRPVSQRSPLRAIGRLSAFAIIGFAAAYLVVVLASTQSSNALNSTPGKPRIAAPNTSKASDPVVDPDGMRWIPAGEFQMGSDEANVAPAEQPRHRVRVDGFWIDETEVTNLQFSEFVTATGYVTLAERTIDWETLRQQLPPGTPKPPDENLQPGSLVFTPPGEAVRLDNAAGWWSWVPGANWRHPEGPDSNLDGKQQHPVVQVSWDDALAYATWAGKRLPTEAEWEFAARGGLEGSRYAWGDELRPQGRCVANFWQGTFPHQNTADDGFARTAPVRSFEANGYGLHDMIGNVWEWCGDWYRTDAYADRSGRLTVNPTGPESSRNPEEPLQAQRVTKGGSFLCSEGYCSNYRPSARRGNATDTGMSHVGFRCVMTPDMETRRKP
ncbi:MAG: formylglycine-generating enzyme family protein [Candidatus Saccharimonas sp.]|nr:formylglycine-generating enzyme family protein [Planctomycetaceae bacterium]